MKRSKIDCGITKDVTISFNSILVVEDDEGLNNLIQKRLQKDGYTTISFTKGRDCINNISTLKDTLIILDYILPDMTGKQVIEVLNKGERVYSRTVSASEFQDAFLLANGRRALVIDRIDKRHTMVDIPMSLKVTFKMWDRHEKAQLGQAFIAITRDGDL